MMLHVHRGKGAKDRYVPIPKETLLLLRKYWRTHRNPILVFPAMGRGCKSGSTSNIPMNRGSVKGELLLEPKRKQISTNGECLFIPLSHSYATHLLEAGVNIRVI